MASEVSSGTMTIQGGEDETGFKPLRSFEYWKLARSILKFSINNFKPRDLPSNHHTASPHLDILSAITSWVVMRNKKVILLGYNYNCDVRIAAEDGLPGLGEGEQDEADQFRSSRSIIPAVPTPRPPFCVYQSMFLRDSALYNHGLNTATPSEEDSVHCSVREPKPFLSLWDAVDNEIASTRQNLHSLLYPPIHHRDLKPSNVLLEEETENLLSDFGLPSSLLHANDYTQIPRGSAVLTHNGLLDAKFLGKPSAKHGIEIKTCSHMTHPRTYLSVHHHPPLKMWLSALKRSADILTRFARLIISKMGFGTAEASWADSTPHSAPVSEYIRKHFHIRNWLTVNESQQHSDPDSRRAKNTKMAATSASWIIATAAPHHATGDRNLLSGFTMEHDDLFAHAVNQVPMKVLARGAVVTDTLILPDVWFVPGLTENLVSVSQLAELDHSMGFGRGECCIRSAPGAKIVGKGRLQKDGQYVLDYLKVPLAI